MRKLLMAVLLLFGSWLSAKDDLMSKVKEGLTESKMVQCMQLSEKLKTSKDSMVNSTGGSLYYNYHSIKNYADKEGYNLPDLTLEQSRAIEAKNKYIEYVDSFANMTNQCVFTNIGMLMITEKKQNDKLFKDLSSHFRLISGISTKLYEKGGISQKAYDSHIKIIDYFEKIYRKFKK